MVSSVVDAVLETSPELSDECDDSLAHARTDDKLRDAVECLKNKKASGGDEIAAELVKLGGLEVVQYLVHLACLVWK